jgi:hypothetical protein
MARTTVGKREARGLSLHIGVNSVNPAHYWRLGRAADGLRVRCPGHGRARQGRSGIKPTVLLTKNATRAKTLAALRSAAKTLKKGDYFLLTFSGHGGQVPDVSTTRRPTSATRPGACTTASSSTTSSTWSWPVSPPAFACSCCPTAATPAPSPRTALRAPSPPAARRRAGCPSPSASASTVRTRLSTTSCSATARRPAAAARSTPTRPWPTSAVSGRVSSTAARMKAAVVLISGCQDNQSSYDGDAQRRLHRAAADGVEPRQLRWQLRHLPRTHQGRHAGDPDAQPVHDGRGGRLHEAKALHRVTLRPAGRAPLAGAARGRDRRSESCIRADPPQQGSRRWPRRSRSS